MFKNCKIFLKYFTVRESFYEILFGLSGFAVSDFNVCLQNLSFILTLLAGADAPDAATVAFYANICGENCKSRDAASWKKA